MINLYSKKLKSINKPARYVGGEVNEIIKSNNVKCKIALCYPNLYEIAMSNYIINLLYNNINLIDNIWCKRCFAPDVDFENLLRENSENLYTLEDFRDINNNDILIFVVDNELDFTNLLNMLELSGIPNTKKNRKKTSPKIIIFPLNNINIKPIEEYADYIFSYDSEKENVQRLLLYLNNYVASDFNKELLACNISEETNNYYNIDIINVQNSIVPSIKINNSSIVIDFEYMNDIDYIINYINSSINYRGINKVSFRNEQDVDNYKFCEIIYKIKMNIPDVKIISKNIDFNKFEPEFLDILLPCMEKSPVYFNVVTCSENIKNKITIGTNKEKLLERIGRVFKNNINSINLDFCIGLPDETYEDIDGIFSLIEEIVNMYSKNRAKDKFSMKVNLLYYIPTNSDKKIYNINSTNKLETKLRYIKEKKCDYVVNLNVEDISSYTTKILLKNGGQEVSDCIYEAYKLGARFDSDTKKYNKNVWEKVLFDNAKITGKYFN